jgi:hypothetical protein
MSKINDIRHFVVPVEAQMQLQTWRLVHSYLSTADAITEYKNMVDWRLAYAT